MAADEINEGLEVAKSLGDSASGSAASSGSGMDSLPDDPSVKPTPGVGADGAGGRGPTGGMASSPGADGDGAKPEGSLEGSQKKFDTEGVKQQSRVAAMNATLQRMAGQKNSERLAARATGRIAGAMLAAGSGFSAVTGGVIGAQVGTAMVGGLTATSVIFTGVYLALNASKSDDMRFDDELPEVHCGEMTDTLLNAQEGGAQVNSDQNDMAKKVYKVLAGAGMPDENIAGILGNMEHESGLDPTSVEGIFTEPFTLGVNKKAAEAHDFAAPNSGIGLNQWSFERNAKLREFAAKKGKHWSDWQTQMAYALGADGNDSKVYQDMLRGESKLDGVNTADSPEIAAKFFMLKWERPLDKSAARQNERVASASKWYVKMKSWGGGDSSLAASVLQAANVANDKSTTGALNKEVQKCTRSTKGMNSSLAEAMASISWSHEAKGKGNDGTDLYIDLHNQIFPGDNYYASCDRSVATAVRWSGTDDAFPPGYTGVQLTYFISSDKWEEIPWSGSEDDLSPGDIAVYNGHIAMYIGPEAVNNVWGGDDIEPNAVGASGSLADRSPGLENYMSSVGYMKAEGAKIFRIKTRETDSKYASIPANHERGVSKVYKGQYVTPGGSSSGAF